MYTPRKIDGIWYIGFLYSDGTFDPIAKCASTLVAAEAAERMNRAMFGERPRQ
jgi:hypothetical protein